VISLSVGMVGCAGLGRQSHDVEFAATTRPAQSPVDQAPVQPAAPMQQPVAEQDFAAEPAVRNLTPCPTGVRFAAGEAIVSDSYAEETQPAESPRMLPPPPMNSDGLQLVTAETPIETPPAAVADVPAEPRIQSPAITHVEAPVESRMELPAQPRADASVEPRAEAPIEASAVPPTKAPVVAAEVVPAPRGLPAMVERPVEVPAATTPHGEPLITLHVDNLDVSKAIEMISRQAKILNIIVLPGVSGLVTLDLRDKTVDETLQIIATQCRLTIRREKDVIYVSTLEDFRKIEEDDLPVRVYHLNYVRSDDVQAMIKPLLSKKGMFTASPESESGLLSDATKAGESKEVKSGGNAMAGGEIVVVQDYEQVLKMVDRVIAQIDVQPIQVLIEAVIVQVKLEKGMELGVNFALLDGAGRAVGVAGSGAAINAAAGFVPASVLAAGNTGLLKGTPTSGLASATPGMKFGFVDQSTTGFIRALETFGETKVLACPRLLVLNKQRADIHLGAKLGYSTTTQTQTSTVQTVQFQDIGTQLRLRPFVSSDGMIRMEVRPERSSGIIDNDGIPQVNAAQVTTNVMVPNGATIVIGGLIESETQNNWAGFPLLSRLPWVGALFRESIDKTTKKELVVILTPRIWRPECPEELNFVGPPKTLGLDARVAQRPCEENRDAPSLYELARPDGCPQACPVAGHVGKASSPSATKSTQHMAARSE
jgi:type IV pilus secretin PilQ/predicted competence protein